MTAPAVLPLPTNDERPGLPCQENVRAAVVTQRYPRTATNSKGTRAMSQATPAPDTRPAPAPKVFVPASWEPVPDPEVLPAYFHAAAYGPVSSTWAHDEGFRYCIEDGPGELTTAETEQLLGNLLHALHQARAAGDRIAEHLAAAISGRTEPTVPESLTAPDRDEIDGSLLSFHLTAHGPIRTSWDPEDGFRYYLEDGPDLDGPGARRLVGALQTVLGANAVAQFQMDDHAARYASGERLKGVEWR